MLQDSKNVLGFKKHEFDNYCVISKNFTSLNKVQGFKKI